MDFAEVGVTLRARLHNGKKPDLVFITLDEIDNFTRMRGANGLEDYRDWLHAEVELELAEDGRYVQIDEYFQFSQYPQSSEWRK